MKQDHGPKPLAIEEFLSGHGVSIVLDREQYGKILRPKNLKGFRKAVSCAVIEQVREALVPGSSSRKVRVENPSNSFPPSKWPSPGKQLARLKEVFPKVKWETHPSTKSFPIVDMVTEHLFVIPDWEKVGRNYRSATAITFGLLASVRHDLDSSGQLTKIEASLGRMCAKTRESFVQIQKMQGGANAICIPGQLGSMNAGYVIGDSLQFMSRYEFPMDIFSLAIILITCPQVLIGTNGLGLVACGCPCVDKKFNTNDYPALFVRNGLLCVETLPDQFAGNYGVLSFMFPKC